MRHLRTAILHYSAAPVVGGVEAVISAQADSLRHAGYPVSVVCGQGAPEALPPGVAFIAIPEMDSQNPEVLSVSKSLEAGVVPEGFDELASLLLEKLERSLAGYDALIVHNVFTKHFNLPLTAALVNYLDRHESTRCIAWCHDFTWTSEHSRSRVHAGYPWDLLRSRIPRARYVTVSRRRRTELSGLLGCPEEEVSVVYNGVAPAVLFGLFGGGLDLVERFGLLDCGLSLLMPVRVTEAKNIEYAIRFASELKRRSVNPRIVLTGPPDPHDPSSLRYFESLRMLTSELGVEEEMRFVYDSGEEPDRPLTVGMDVVAQLYRACDLLFMPSHREGFGMPVLEAGLIGMPVVSSRIPAAEELASEGALIFEPELPAAALADRVLAFVQNNPVLQMRIRVRRELSWRAIFRRQIEPLLTGGRGAHSEGTHDFG